MNKIFSAFTLGLVTFGSAAFAAPDAHSILKDSDQARGGGLPGIVWEIKLQSRDGERSDEPQRILVKAVDDSSVAETQEPARFKGSKILQVERNMWMTRPGLSKPIPISPRPTTPATTRRRWRAWRTSTARNATCST